MSYTQGDLVELPATFRDSATGQPADPDSLSLRVVAPDDSTTTYTYPGVSIQRTSVGEYVGAVPAVLEGRYLYEWVLTGSLQAVAPADFEVAAALPAAAAARRARADLAQLVVPTMEPLLTDAAMDFLLRRARRADADGRPPSDPAWIPTYDLNSAASEGWELKAGMAAGDYDFAASGQRFDRSKVHEQCLKMAELYARGTGGSVAIGSGILEQYNAAVAEGLAPGGVTL